MLVRIFPMLQMYRRLAVLLALLLSVAVALSVDEDLRANLVDAEENVS